MRKILLSLFALAVMATSNVLFAQGVTTGSLSGVITDGTSNILPGATVIAVHVPSGTRYGSTSFIDGRYVIPGVRVGGPYSITVSFVGFDTQVKENITVNLGTATNINFNLAESVDALAEVLISASRSDIFSSDRTGAGTAIGAKNIQTLPTISRRINDFTRLTPQVSGNSIAGQDGRLNNITVDGSYFNNSFGLGSQPGDRTGVSPISIDAIEQIQVNIAPYDVRQGNFVGGGINTVTKSGTNEVKGTVYNLFRNENFVGTKAGDNEFNPGTFNYNMLGATVGLPLIKDKLFLFASFETEKDLRPMTTFRANTGTETVEGNTTRVLASDLDQLSTFLNDNFGYETGPYQGYDRETSATKWLGRLDYNINDNHKLSIRYTHVNSFTDVPLSNSSSLGFGSRNFNLNGLNFRNSNYQIKEDIRSLVGELNSRFGNNMSNNLIIGYTYQDESRASLGSFFPMVDILDAGSVYTTFGFEPFTPNNELRYKTFQLQNNFTMYKGAHTLTFGFSAERYESENVFFPGAQSAYVYNSLDDFYADANNFLNPDPAYVNPQLRRFQVRYMAQPGLEKPVQPLEVFYAGLYAQDEFKVNEQLNLTLGLRVDVPFFGETGFRNPEVETFDFVNADGETVKYRTDKLPNANPLISPRLGFNYDLSGDRSTQIRGGSGLFTGRPAYVWISNQIGNNGVLTGFIQGDNTTAYPFNPDPDHYKPVITTVQPAPSYELALTETDFKFPQVWRTNVAIDQKLPLGLVATAEFIYTKDVNGVSYFNANLPLTDTAFSGADARSRWTAGNRINGKIPNAIVLANQNDGSSYNIAFSLERPFQNGLFAKVAYSYGVTKNIVDPGSIAGGSYFNNPQAGNPNNPGLGFSSNNLGNRIIAAVTYSKEYFEIGGTTVSLFVEGINQGVTSYVFNGDLNGDGGFSNDLIYIPRNASEMNFEEWTSGTGSAARTYTIGEQEAAWEAYINQDPYLKENRGSYAERGGLLLPMVWRADFNFTQEIFSNFGGKRNTLQFRADILNVGNMLNNKWGVGQAMFNNRPLIARGADANGEARYRLANVSTGGDLISSTFRDTAGATDVWRLQLGVRYIFN